MFSQLRTMIAVALVALALGVAATNYLQGGLGKFADAAGNAEIPSHFADVPPNERMRGVMDGVNLLLKPEIANGLGMSTQQRSNIKGIMVGASNSLSGLYEDCQGKPPEVWYTQSQGVMNEALENILCSLTDEQILKWRELMMRERSQRRQ